MQVCHEDQDEGDDSTHSQVGHVQVEQEKVNGGCVDPSSKIPSGNSVKVLVSIVSF
jgi:hypothetical protein